MLQIFQEFFHPYIQVIYGMGYTALQIFEELGLLSTNFIGRNAAGIIVSSYWSPSEAVLPFLGFLLLYSIFLTIIVLFASYILYRWLGVIFAILIMAFPGILKVLGLFPQIDYVPSTFYILGSGDTLGNPLDLFFLVVIAMLGGWAITVTAYHTFRMTDNFRNIYDHLWYAAAIPFVVFFVTTSNSTNTLNELYRDNRISRQASNYLLNQVEQYSMVCKKNKLTSSKSCEWASNVQQRLNEYASYGPNLFSTLGPKSSKEIYEAQSKNNEPDDTDKIINEIHYYNYKTCSENNQSGTCQRTPPNYCSSYPDRFNIAMEEQLLITPSALASECIIPTLVKLRDEQAKLTDVVKSENSFKYIRWIIYVIIGILTGIKIANSSTKLAKIDGRRSPISGGQIQLFRKIKDLLVTFFGRLKIF